MTIVEQLQPLAIQIADLVPDPANARLHNERNIEAIKASLRAFGQRKPIVVQKQGMVVPAGNGTLQAAKALGWTEIAAVIVDEDSLQATQFAIADNRTAELAECCILRGPRAVRGLPRSQSDEPASASASVVET